MVIPRKINFLQLERFGTRVEQVYRQTFEREVDWVEMNIWLAAQAFRNGSRRLAIAIDPSYISKAGKHTPHIGTFWSGCAGAAKHGLEILGIGLVDADLHDCMMLRAVQTKVEEGSAEEEMSLYDWYAKVMTDYKEKLQRITTVMVADAAFSKKTFVDKILAEGYHLVSRLRNDADLRYIYDGPRAGKRGRPRSKGDKIDFDNLDFSKMKPMDIDPKDGHAYELTAYCRSLKRNISLVIHILPKGGHRLYFATDLSMSGTDVMDFYRTRFQIEFNYRDAKQFTGLYHCQARDERKLDFAFNSSFCAVNIAKLIRRTTNQDLSIGRLKSLMVNGYYLERIIDVFEKDPNTTLNAILVKELLDKATCVA